MYVELHFILAQATSISFCCHRNVYCFSVIATYLRKLDRLTKREGAMAMKYWKCLYVLFCVLTVGCRAVTSQNGASYDLQNEGNKLFKL
jgi:hypothetical protein